jgi:hypothetical protein
VGYVVVFLTVIGEFLIIFRFFHDGGHLQQMKFAWEKRKMERWWMTGILSA